MFLIEIILMNYRLKESFIKEQVLPCVHTNLKISRSTNCNSIVANDAVRALDFLQTVYPSILDSLDLTTTLAVLRNILIEALSVKVDKEPVRHGNIIIYDRWVSNPSYLNNVAIAFAGFVYSNPRLYSNLIDEILLIAWGHFIMETELEEERVKAIKWMQSFKLAESESSTSKCCIM